MQTRFTNRLINETSPYLLQHAHNPVDWFAWGDEALSKARAENKVILVSIGYSACHWCHVMERESFENETIAELMNDHFVNIKIDREERPDLDHIYMDAVQAITGSGGWPLNVFLTPDAKPFYGGTYFPPVKAFNRSSWTEILEGVATAWKDRKNQIESQAENLTDHLRQANSFGQTEVIIPAAGNNFEKANEQCDAMFAAIMLTADTLWGGFGKAPKFPQTFTVQYLLQYHHFTGNKKALQQAILSIDKMMLGGIYDHVGGGLARYSTDIEWLAPHFEKMLYDNALFIIILCDAYQLTSESKYEDAIRKTISFITNELLNGEGGFYAALDADSEGEEGKYYVWQKAEIDSLLNNDSELFCSFFNITDSGNWEGKNILRILKPINEFVEEHHLEKGSFVQTIEDCLQKLLNQRELRIKPALDDKIILGWNALMVKAIARAGIVLQDESYKMLAVSNFDFLIKKFKKDNTEMELLHTYKNGKAKYPAFLDDYAYLISAALQLYKATFEEKYLETANEYVKYVINNFGDEHNVFFFFTHASQEDVIVGKKEIYDGATPSGNSVMAENLILLSVIYDQAEWRTRANKMLESLLPSILKYPGSFGIWASLLLQQAKGMNEIVVIGADYVTVSNNILLNFIPSIIIMASEKANNRFSLYTGKYAGSSSNIYLCRNSACLAPYSDTETLMKEINKTNIITE